MGDRIGGIIQSGTSTSLVDMRLWTRNARLLDARHAKGWNVQTLASMCGMATPTFSRIENLRKIATESQKQIIATALEQNIEWLFPPVLDTAISDGVFELRHRQLGEKEVKLLPHPPKRWKELTTVSEDELTDNLDAELLKKAVRECLADLKDALSSRTVLILDMRFGLSSGKSSTLEEVAQRIGVTRERIRQIEAKALRTLRRNNFTVRLRPFIHPESDEDTLDKLRDKKSLLSIEELKLIHDKLLHTKHKRREKV